MCRVIIFGTGEIAQLAKFYFDHDSDIQVVAFCVDKTFCVKDEFEGLPLVSFEDVESIYPPNEFKMFVALSYRNMNNLRLEKYNQAKSKGYELVSYISSKSTILNNFTIGDNCFILEDNTIQPFVEIGSNVTIWSGNHIGHHSVILNNVFVSSHVVISGHCRIGLNSFLGVNSTIGHNVNLGKATLVGAGSIITKDTEENSVYVPSKSIKLNKSSNEINL